MAHSDRRTPISVLILNFSEIRVSAATSGLREQRDHMQRGCGSGTGSQAMLLAARPLLSRNRWIPSFPRIQPEFRIARSACDHEKPRTEYSELEFVQDQKSGEHVRGTHLYRLFRRKLMSPSNQAICRLSYYPVFETPGPAIEMQLSSEKTPSECIDSRYRPWSSELVTHASVESDWQSSSTATLCMNARARCVQRK